MKHKGTSQRPVALVIAIVALGSAQSAHAFVLAVPLLGAIIPMLHQLVQTAVNNALTLPAHFVDSAIHDNALLRATINVPGAFNYASSQAMGAFQAVFSIDAQHTRGLSSQAMQQQAMKRHQATLTSVFQHLHAAHRLQQSFLQQLMQSALLAHGVTGQLQALQANGDVNIMQAHVLQQLHSTLMAQTQAQITHAAFVVQQQAQQQATFSLSVAPSPYHAYPATHLSAFIPLFTSHEVLP